MSGHPHLAYVDWGVVEHQKGYHVWESHTIQLFLYRLSHLRHLQYRTVLLPLCSVQVTLVSFELQ
jgi:hypothetical protein